MVALEFGVRWVKAEALPPHSKVRGAPPFLHQGEQEAAATTAKTKNRSEDRPLQKRELAGPPEGGRYVGVEAVAEFMVAGMLTDWPS